jgi:hypothetical protein
LYLDLRITPQLYVDKKMDERKELGGEPAEPKLPSIVNAYDESTTQKT